MRLIHLKAAGAGLAFGMAAAGSVVAAPDAAAVVDTYADIAEAGYADSLATAKALNAAIDGLLAKPSADSLAAAKSAWLAARVPYQQTEVYRFGNVIVDEWEGRVNAWPLDEGLIDYVDGGLYGSENAENPFYAANIIATPKLEVSGRVIDTTELTPETIAGLHEIDEVEANVAIGYHAIEFLLWGQDLNGTGPGAGNRPWTDYATGDACTGGHCERRRAYLKAAADLLVADLAEMTGNWTDGGAARASLVADPAAGLVAMLTGMGSLSYGELGGERTKLGLMLHDPEEEHDCFSDNTHNSHFYDAKGVQNVYLGSYGAVKGTSLSDLVRATDPVLDTEIRAALDATMTAAQAIKDKADSGAMAYDQMLADDNPAGNALVQAFVDALVAQTGSFEKAVAVLGLGAVAFEGSDSLDNPRAVFQ